MTAPRARLLRTRPASRKTLPIAEPDAERYFLSRFRRQAESLRRSSQGRAAMPFLPSIGPEDKVPHVWAKFQNGTQMPIIQFHEALLRGESPFSVKER
jgi:hypothetical protein